MFPRNSLNFRTTRLFCFTETTVGKNGQLLHRFATWCMARMTKRLSDIIRPKPTQLFVFIDENADTLLDAQFGNMVGMPGYAQIWWDKPADRHNQGGNLSLADGHAERWRWRVPKNPAYAGQPLATGESPDFQRIQDAMKKWSDN